MDTANLTILAIIIYLLIALGLNYNLDSRYTRIRLGAEPSLFLRFIHFITSISWPLWVSCVIALALITTAILLPVYFFLALRFMVLALWPDIKDPIDPYGEE